MKFRKLSLIALIAASMTLMPSCKEEDPVEEAADEIGDSLEDAADEIGDGLREIGDEIEDGAEKVKKGKK